MLINDIGEFVELITGLDVVGSEPAALKERYILVELVVLAGVDLGILLIKRVRGGVSRKLQGGRQWDARSAWLRRAVRKGALATRLPTQVYPRGGPTGVMVVVEA